MHIIPIASGKGGVGKSLFAANLSIALGKAGRKVVLADLDLGASNLHVMLGIAAPTAGLGSYLSGGSKGFGDTIVDSGYENVLFIPGDSEIPGLANIKSFQKNQLVRKLLSLDADYLVIDLGAGTSANILDFFLSGSRGIIVTAPTLTATLNAYLFLKNAVFRIMYTTFGTKSKAFECLESMRKDGSSLRKAYVPAILEEIRSVDPDKHAEVVTRLAQFRPRIVMNMLEDPKDAERAQKIRRSCREYLSVDLEHLGIVYRDSMQDVALSGRIPIIVYKPQSILSQAVFRIADKLIQCETETESPFNEEYLDDSFMSAGMEAEIDFESKLGYVEELLDSGTLSTGDLVETVKSQQFELAQVRKENQLLKYKLANAIRQGFKP